MYRNTRNFNIHLKKVHKIKDTPKLKAIIKNPLHVWNAQTKIFGCGASFAKTTPVNSLELEVQIKQNGSNLEHRKYFIHIFVFLTIEMHGLCLIDHDQYPCNV